MLRGVPLAFGVDACYGKVHLNAELRIEQLGERRFKQPEEALA